MQQDDGQSCYADKLLKQEATIDWQQNAELLARKIRAFNSSNVMFTEVAGQRIKIWIALAENSKSEASPGTVLQADKQGLVVACGEGRLLLQQLQMPGGKVLDYKTILDGHREKFNPGTQLGSHGQD